jgi:4-hydroxybenzoate polyprenyltransferase
MMRPRQWTKNLLVFAGLIFAGNIAHLESLLISTAAFILFCLASSSVYLFNDIVDLRSDRDHPLKSRRPLSRGAVSVVSAGSMSAVLALLSAGGAFLLRPGFGAVIVSYLLISLLYCLIFKRVVIVDVFIIAAGFVLRAVSGAVVLGIFISPWLLICTVLLALFLGLGKRRHELILLEGKAARHRQTLGEYTEPLLDHMISMVGAAAIVTYCLYTFFSETAASHPYWLMATIPFVIYGILRYLYLMHVRKEGGSPEMLLLSDLPLAIDILLWGSTSAAILVMTR